MTAQHNVQYTYGQARDILYPFGGATQDYFHQTLNTPLSFTWELRDTGDYGFILPQNQIQPQWDEVKAGFIAMLQFINEEIIE